jgi:ABC-type nitrate/sulfonate/bicarbonate transport system ATPase subunit
MAEQVTLHRVGKTFSGRAGELPVLHEVSLPIAAGSIVALLGPSGCGKSTLLRMIAGLERPTAGEVRLGDRPVTRADPRCAVVFQEPRLFPWLSVEQNVAFGARRLADPPAPDTLLGLVGLGEFRRAHPHHLSGGMAQRAALARALIGAPEVLLLDEPFAALDALTRMQMQDLVADVHARLRPTVVLVTHDVDEALILADRIVILGRRPATIAATIDVALPRPRDRGDVALAPLRAQILAHFGLSHAATAAAAAPVAAPALQEVSQ